MAEINTKKSCTLCSSTLKGLVKVHEAAFCPLKKGYYCGVCATYGHSPSNCPDTMTHLYRQPMFVEQLIPPSALEEYGITSRTPLKGIPLPEARLPPMVIPETSEGLRAALISMDLRPKICQAQNLAEEMRINKGRLEELERETVFIDPKEVVPTYSQPPRRFPLKRKAVV
jgi:hypothetical protein